LPDTPIYGRITAIPNEPIFRFLTGSSGAQVQELINKGQFNLSLLARFSSGQIWNEDYLALEVLFQRQPELRPKNLDTNSGSMALQQLRNLAVRHQSILTPIRENIVRPVFGNPANFQIDASLQCPILNLSQDVLKLGPLPGGKSKQGGFWYKRDARRSPRKEDIVDSIVLHHMAYNIGNNVNSYKKVGAHYIVTADGQIAQLYDDLDFLNASNGFNSRSVAIEFAGNFADYRYHWWKSSKLTIPDRCYLTPAQIRAGRCLLATLKARHPSIKYLYAHRQSSKSRENDPGPDVWFNIGQWAIDNLNLTDRLPRTHIANGQPISEIWRMKRPAISTTIVPHTPTPEPQPTQSAVKPPAELVRFAQRVLNATEGERLDDDGDLGRLTRAALEGFRKKFTLGASGVLDGKTELALVQRALEELSQQSLFGQLGVLDGKTEQALIAFKAEQGIGFGAILDAPTRVALTNALAQRTTSTKAGHSHSTSVVVNTVQTSEKLVARVEQYRLLADAAGAK
jgi:peptidoglycan hydrolase-like protein with peptidoglycan-binding domain